MRIVSRSVAKARRIRSLLRPAPGWAHRRSLSDHATDLDLDAANEFIAAKGQRATRFDILFSYFLRGALDHLSADGARIEYPGLPSIFGHDISGLEGWARTAPLFAAWIASGRPTAPTPFQHAEPIDLVSFLAKGLTEGTDPSSGGFWGDFVPNDQRIVEAADIARVVWMTRDIVWPLLSNREKSHVTKWLRNATEARFDADNNWLLFPVTIDAVLSKMSGERWRQEHRYREFRENYLSNGWFRDGPLGPVDFYNAWGITYELYWLHNLLPEFDTDFLRHVIEESGELTRHLIAPAGIPIMGRSTCYRTAISTSVIAASRLPSSSVSAGAAARALEATWDYFVGNGVLRNGTMTMGYLHTDPRLVENYSGPGSCHWGLRSLTLAYLSAPNAPFWNAQAIPLPVEQGNYELDLPALGWTVVGQQPTQTVCIIQNEFSGHAHVHLLPQSSTAKFMERFLRRPFRPANFPAKYHRRKYVSDIFPS